jgi:hypothetical protein
VVRRAGPAPAASPPRRNPFSPKKFLFKPKTLFKHGSKSQNPNRSQKPNGIKETRSQIFWNPLLIKNKKTSENSPLKLSLSFFGLCFILVIFATVLLLLF